MSDNKVSCKDVMEHICDSLGEELDSSKCVAIREHLEGCDNCTTYMKSVDTTIKFYKNYNAELSEESHNNLFDMLGLNKKDCK